MGGGVPQGLARLVGRYCVWVAVRSKVGYILGNKKGEGYLVLTFPSGLCVMDCMASGGGCGLVLDFSPQEANCF